MVVILQQTTDNGKRFVSTVVNERGGSSVTSRISAAVNRPRSSHQSTVSEQSAIYKQRIDSLFGYQTNCGGGPVKTFGLPKIHTFSNMSTEVMSEDEGYQRIEEEREPLTSTSIVADSLNVDKFSQVTGNGRVASKVSVTSAPSPPWRPKTTDLVYKPEAPTSANGILQFPVQYLGSVPIQGSTTALNDLQTPLRLLYLNLLRGQTLRSGQLSITSAGLQFEGSRVRLLNAFSTISVWAAIKFVCRGDPVPTECAFLPLISDPEGQDKRRLFSKMDSDLKTAFGNMVNSADTSGFCNPPIFACVTRVTGQNQDRSECHAFTCKCAEDAIVVAANLYQYLLVNELKLHKEGESGYGSLTHSSPAMTNQHSLITCARPDSSASSLLSPTDETTSGCGSMSCSGANQGHPDTGRSKVDAEHSDESCSLLKMPIQRRKSFKATYSNRYHQRPTVKVKKRVKISAPPDHRAEDSLERMLDRVLDPRERALEDLKPSYKKLILRLALILTQKKNKDAKKKHQRFVHVATASKLRKSEAGVSTSKSALRDSSRPRVVLNPIANGGRLKDRRLPAETPSKDGLPLVSICSGCLCDNCSEKCYCSLPLKQDHRASSVACSGSITPKQELEQGVRTNKKLEPNQKKDKGCGYDTESCAESEKCYCSLQRVKSNGIKIYNINLDTETSDTDTNSYDLESFHQKSTIPKVSQENRNGRSPSVKMLKYNPGRRASSDSSHEPETNMKTHKGTNSTGNPFVRNTNSSSSNDEDLHHGRNSPSRRQRKKVLLLPGSTSNSSRENSVQRDPPPGIGKKAPIFNSPRRALGSISEDDNFPIQGGCAKELVNPGAEDVLNSLQVLDMKKTAEIEAMFTNLNVGSKFEPKVKSDRVQGHTRPKLLKSVRQSSTSADFQTSLGYLP